MNEIKQGFAPFFNGDSKALILGSFPSVKSRQVDFYYGNPQNKFWAILAEFFKEVKPQTLSEKKDFLTRNKIALWDIVTRCEIVGSSDSSIKNYTVANLREVLDFAPIERILINGGTAYKIFEKNYRGLSVPYVRLASTSPANTKCDKEEWFNELSRTFSRT